MYIMPTYFDSHRGTKICAIIVGVNEIYPNYDIMSIPSGAHTNYFHYGPILNAYKLCL